MRFVQRFVDEMANASCSGVAAYETRATAKVSVTQYISKRYGCDKVEGHHKRTKCMISGRVDYLSKKLEQATDPKQKAIIMAQIKIWKSKASDELVRPKLRKFD